MNEGNVVGGYILKKYLCNGGTAEVWLAEKENQTVVIKRLNSDIARDKHAQQTFDNEVRNHARLEHPGIIRVLGWGTHPDNQRREFPYIVMEYAPNGDLSRMYPVKNLPLPSSIVISYIKHIAKALHYAHTEKHIIHCDLKPENMFMDKNFSIKIGDFGYSRIWRGTQGISSSIPRGRTSLYAAPEQFDDNVFGRVSFAADQYSLANIAYRWLSGRSPYRESEEGLSEYNLLCDHTQGKPVLLEGYPLKVSQCFIKALSKFPKERYASVLDFAQALENVLPSLDVAPVPSRHANNLLLQGIAQKIEKSFHEALQSFSGVIAIDPNNGAAYRERGIVYRELMHYENSLQDLEKAIAINPRDKEAQKEREITSTRAMKKDH